MSKILQQTIVPIAAVVGVQAVNLVLSPLRPAQSSSCLQWANEAVQVTSERLQRTFNPPYVPEGMTEGEYNQLREVFHTDDIRLAQPQPATTQARANAGASASPQATAIGAALPQGMTETEYQAQRRALAGGGY